MKRRTFLRGVTAVTSAVTATAVSSRRVLGAGDRIRMGWIGCGGRGRFVAERMRRDPSVEFVAVCDVYDRHRERAQQWLGSSTAEYSDFRGMLDRDDIDAVLVATPDHWHAAITVLACRAGKDVYVEKPASHNIREGQAMVRAAREHDRVVQVGTQQRSARHFEQIHELIRTGRLGSVRMVRIWNYRNMFPNGIGKQPVERPLPGLDWDFFLGPAPEVPFTVNRFRQFRYFLDYSGGVITDWGVHRFDSMHHIMDVDTPVAIAASGGRYELDDDGDVPDTIQVTYEYPGFVCTYEASLLNAHGCEGRTPGRAYYRANGVDDRPNGMAFYGTNGTVVADRLGFEVFPELKPGRFLPQRGRVAVTPDYFRMERSEGTSPDSTADHVDDFLQCVRSRRRPVADIQRGHRATTVALLGNIALTAGRKLRWDGEHEQFIDDADATKRLGREARSPWDLI